MKSEITWIFLTREELEDLKKGKMIRRQNGEIIIQMEK
jgi:hypothetical protein